VARRRFSALIGALSAAALLAAACAPAAPAPAPAKQEAAPAKATSVDSIVQAAKAEGKLNVTGPSNLGDDGLAKIVAAMNAKHGTNIQAQFSSAGQAGPIVAQIITERTTGGKPTWDVIIQNEAQISKLWTDGHLQAHPYQQVFGINPGAVIFDQQAVGFANQLVLPVYNTKLVQGADIPKSWDDVVLPKWKDKIGVSTSVHHLVRLSQAWGDDKATEYAKKLAALNPKLGQLNENYQRLILGETHLSFTQTNTQVDNGKRKGEPMDWAIDVRPAVATTYTCSAIKDAPNPNAAALFCGFMADKGALEVWYDKLGRQSILDTSTSLGELYAKNPKDVVILDPKFAADELENREKKYTPILGFR
jgi:iron(III) transport system substrate-binding protein